jgi:hypothetical protein
MQSLRATVNLTAALLMFCLAPASGQTSDELYSGKTSEIDVCDRGQTLAT